MILLIFPLSCTTSIGTQQAMPYPVDIVEAHFAWLDLDSAPLVTEPVVLKEVGTALGVEVLDLRKKV